MRKESKDHWEQTPFSSRSKFEFEFEFEFESERKITGTDLSQRAGESQVLFLPFFKVGAYEVTEVASSQCQWPLAGRLRL